LVAEAMADSKQAPMSEAIVGTAAGRLVIAGNAGTQATAGSRWSAVADGG
jgi:hypothetical protein